MSLSDVVFRPLDKAGAAFIEQRREDGHGSGVSARSFVNDSFRSGEVLADQSPSGSAVTFQFSAPVDLIWIRCAGGNGRADPFGGTPADGQGIVCEDGIPNPLTITTDTVMVWAPTDVTVNVYGYRYAP